jgi:hypothetical protein
MEFEDIKKSFDKIEDINEIEGYYEVKISGVEKTLKIKIIEEDGGKFLGLANLEVRGKGCATHYRSLHPRKTKEEAFEEAIRGFFVFYSEEADVREVENW